MPTKFVLFSYSKDFLNIFIFNWKDSVIKGKRIKLPVSYVKTTFLSPLVVGLESKGQVWELFTKEDSSEFEIGKLWEETSWIHKGEKTQNY